MTTTATTTPAVWVGCLACYNNGRLTGDWVNAEDAATHTPCTRVDYGSPHEEWWVMDHEGFDGLLTGECSPMDAAELAELHATLTGEGVDIAAYVYWCQDRGHTILEGWEDHSENFREAYAGHHDSPEDWAATWLEDVGMLAELPDWAKSYESDVAAAWLHDVVAGGEVHFEADADHGVHVFWTGV